MIKHISISFIIVFLAGCSLKTDIQKRYVSQRDFCRDQATTKQMAIQQTREIGDARVRDVKLLTYFSQCMGQQGWTVASPNPTRPNGPTPPIDLDARKKPGYASQDFQRKIPVENPGGQPQNTPLSSQSIAPLSLQNPQPSPSAVPQNSAQQTYSVTPDKVSTSRAGVPVYESDVPAAGDPTRTMEEDWLRANRRR